MKPKGKHPHNRLTAAKVRRIKQPGFYADGNSLYLKVGAGGAKSWIHRALMNGKRRDFGLGGVLVVTLGEAREQVIDNARMIRGGVDPAEHHRKSRTDIPTFQKAAEIVHAARAEGWRNGKHGKQWLATLRTYCFPHFGDTRVDQISTADVLKALGPIWLKRPETSRRVKQRIAAIMDWAKAAKYRTGDNPVHGIETALPKRKIIPKHHEAMPYADVSAFVASLHDCDAGCITKLAFEFLILTAARTGEVLQASPAQFDIENALWTVPEHSTKSGLVHRVPLSSRALEIIEKSSCYNAGLDVTFPGRKYNRPISNMAFAMVLRRMGVNVTAHGFRSSFKDWTLERGRYPNEVSERALAHVPKDRVERAYGRSDLLDLRRPMMEAWSAFLTSDGADIVQLSARGKAS